eukprot:SAG22_NODE_7751_length_711_cov_1.109477_1_plen_90_part_00
MSGEALLSGGGPAASIQAGPAPSVVAARTVVRGTDFTRALANVAVGLLGAGCLFSGSFCAFEIRRDICPLGTAWWLALVAVGFALLLVI